MPFSASKRSSPYPPRQQGAAETRAAPGPGNGGSGGAPATRWYVNPVDGDDDNDGTEAAPFKTVAKAVTVAQAGEIIETLAGTYSGETGETWGYTPAAGVTIHAEGPEVIFRGTQAETAFVLSAPVIIEGMAIRQFALGFEVTAEDVELKRINLDANTQGVDVVSGSLNTDDLNIRDGLRGIRVQAGTAEINGGEISGMGVGCDEYAVLVSGDAAVDLIGTDVVDNPGTVVELADTARMDVTLGAFTNVGGNCSHVFSITGTNTLNLQQTSVSNWDGNLVGAPETSTATISITDSSTMVDGTSGLWLHNANLTVSDSTLGGIPGYALEIYTGTEATLTNVDVDDNASGILVHDSAGSLRLRDSTIINSTSFAGAGVRLEGNDTNTTTSVDLGTMGQPGGNTFLSNSPTIHCLWDSGLTIQAVGNLWTPNMQDADGTGAYTCMAGSCNPLPGGSGEFGENFWLAGPNCDLEIYTVTN